MKLKTIIFSVALYAVVLIPNTTSAFDVLDQSAIQLTEDTFLLQIDYRLNYLNYDTYAPITPKEGPSGNSGVV